MNFRSPVVGVSTRNPDGYADPSVELPTRGGDLSVLLAVSGLAGVASVLAPVLVGAPCAVAFGDLLAVDRLGTESTRGRACFVGLALAFGVLAWMPLVDGTVARVALGIAVAPLALVPTFVADRTTSWLDAIVRSLDLTARAGAGWLARVATVVAFFALTPSATYAVRHLAVFEGAPVRALFALVPAWLLASVGALPACLALRSLSREARSNVAHRAPATRLGMLSVIATVVIGVWTLTALPTLLGARGVPALGWPSGVRAVEGAGVLVELHGADAGILVQRLDGRLFVDAVAPSSIGPDGALTHAEATSFGDERAFALHLGAFVLAVVVLAVLGAIAWTRGGVLGALVSRSRAFRVRLSARDLEIERKVLRPGAELTMSDGARIVVEDGMPLVGAVPSAESDAIEASVLAPRAWKPVFDYRHVPSAPPRGALLVLGEGEDAVALARLRDLRHPVALALALFPTLLVLVAGIYVLGG